VVQRLGGRGRGVGLTHRRLLWLQVAVLPGGVVAHRQAALSRFEAVILVLVVVFD